MTMTRKPIAIATLLVVMTLGSPAMAVDIENTDEKDYEVTILPGDGQNNTTIILQAGTTEEDVCTSCRIKIEGVGEVDAKEGDDFEISGGKISEKSD